ncbi:MAG: hypothetical protein NPIRA04_06390 [Nitrospirales bacterium]|nr:MAG: hypothetical protein NPIRA04_06390 [Nitrospirales bacterium]
MTFPNTIQTMRIIGLMCFLLAFILSVPSKGQGAFILNADDIQANKWMELSPENRASFVFGFLAGLDHVYNTQGLVVTLKRSLSAQELSAEVYKSLLDHPELRTGPIDEIILNALDNLLSISNKSGLRMSPGLREINQRAP